MKSLLLLLLLAQSWMALAQQTLPVVHRTLACLANTNTLDNAIDTAIDTVYASADPVRNLRLGQRELPNCCLLCQGFPPGQCWVVFPACRDHPCGRRMEQDEDADAEQQQDIQDIPISRRLPSKGSNNKAVIQDIPISRRPQGSKGSNNKAAAQQYSWCQNKLNKFMKELENDGLDYCVTGECIKEW